MSNSVERLQDAIAVLHATAAEIARLRKTVSRYENTINERDREIARLRAEVERLEGLKG